MSKRTPKSADGGLSRPRRGAAATSPPGSTPSASRSRTSNTRYLPPRTVEEFAAQASDVCTRLLNGQIDPKLAQTYGTVARVVSQTFSAQVTKGRFLKEMPDLTLNLRDDEE
jgi:hypothetical protein